MTKLKENLHILLAPLITLTIFALFYVALGLYPFGEKTIAWCDMEQQVIPILAQFKDIIEGESGLFYNAQSAGGMNFIGVLLFFVFSPFSLMVALVDKVDIIFLMNIITPLKLSVSALTASAYFQKKLSNPPLILNLLLSLMYAFCGFGMFYYQNSVWLDIMYLFPILLLGVESLIKERKPTKYILALSAIVVVNFYMTYMIAIFLILYMGVHLKFEAKSDEKSAICFHFISASATSMLIGAVAWLPAFLQYLESARGSGIILSITSGTFVGEIDDKLTVILCTGLATLVGACCVFRRYRRKLDSKVELIMFLLLTITIIIEPANKMWQTGNYQAFPYRYSYMAIMMGLVVAGKVIMSINRRNRHKQTKANVFIAGAIVVLFTAGTYANYKLNLEDMSSYTRSLWVDTDAALLIISFSCIAIMSYWTLLTMHESKRLSRTLVVSFMGIIFISEAFMHTAIFYSTPKSKDIALYESIYDLEDRIEDDSFYRVKMQKKYVDVNTISAIGYNNLAHYTSLTNKDYLQGMKKLGYSSYWMEVNSNGGTLISDAILAQKYSIDSRFLGNSEMDEIYTNDRFRISRNNYTLNGAYLSNQSPTQFGEINTMCREDVQRQIATQYLGTDEMVQSFQHNKLTNVEYQLVEGRHTYTRVDESAEATVNYLIAIDEKTTLYADLFDNVSVALSEDEDASLKISVNGVVVENSYPSQKNNGIFELGTFENEIISVQLELLKDISAQSMGVFGIDVGEFEEAINSARGTSISPVISKNKVQFSIESNDYNYLYIAIPFDKSFKAYVNGEPSKIYKVNDTFMAVQLVEGDNEIELKFISRGIYHGAVLSVIGLALLVILHIVGRKKEPTIGEKVGVWINFAMKIVVIGTIFVVYIGSTIMYIIHYIAGMF